MSNKEKKEAKKPRYSKDDKLRAVMLIQECGGNATHASRICNIPRTTLLQWQKRMQVTLPRDPELQEVKAEIVQHIADARREFLSKYYHELANTFGLAIHKTREALMNVDEPPTAITAITVAEKLAGIIKDFSIAEDVGVKTDDLLQICIARMGE